MAFATGSGSGPAVADAGRAAVADRVEAQRLERRQQARLASGTRSRPRAGREAGLHVRLDVQSPASTAFFASSPAPSITDGLTGVRAAGDGRDDDGAVADRARAAVACRPRTLRVVSLSASPKPRSSTGAVRPLRNAAFMSPSATRSCGRFGPARHGSTVAQVELQRVGEHRVGRGVGAEQALFLAVALDQLRPASAAAGAHAGSRASRRRPGRSPSSRRIRAPCWRSSRDRRSDMAARPGPKNSTNLSTTPFLRSICVTVSTRSVAVTPSAQLAGELEADDLGRAACRSAGRA